MTDTSDTESAFFGSLLSNPAEFAAAAMGAGVKADWFADDTWAVAWTAVESLWRRGVADTADAVAVLTEARRVYADEAVREKWPSARLDVAKFTAAMDVPSIGVVRHAEDLRVAAFGRRLEAAVRQTLASLANTSPEAAALDLRRRVDALLAGTAEGRKVDAARVYGEILDEYETAHRMRVAADGPRDLTWCPGFRFPWAPMTAMMNGLEPGLGVIAARPSVGKTLFALNLIRYWCDHGVRVVFNSLDMADRSLLRRFVAERSRVSIAKAKFSPTRRDLDAMRRAADECAAYPLTLVGIDDVDEFRTFVQIEKSAGRCDVVVVDYLGLLHTRQVRAGDEYATVSYCSDALKGMANRMGLPVIALCQLNRDVSKSDAAREPGLCDLRGSGKIEQDAYWALFLHREESVVNGTWRSAPPAQLCPPGASAAVVAGLDSVFAILCKSQNGALGKLPFVFRKNYLSAHLGDWRAKPVATETGYGATRRTAYDWTPCFSKVCSDWRRDPFEETLAAQGALIRLSDDAAAPAETAPGADGGMDGDSDPYGGEG